MKARRILLVALVAALSLTAVLAIAALLVGGFHETEGKILLTTGGSALASLFAIRGTILLDQGRYRALGWTIVVLSATAFLLELKVVWLDGGDSPVTWKALAITAGFAGALGQIATSLARRRSQDPPSVRPLGWTAGACALALEAMIAFAAIEEVDDSGYYRFLGAVFVLDVLLVALESVVRRLGRAAPPFAPVSFACVLADGRRVRHEAPAQKRAEAVAAALRELEAKGERVRWIDLGTD